MVAYLVCILFYEMIDNYKYYVTVVKNMSFITIILRLYLYIYIYFDQIYNLNYTSKSWIQ